MCGRARRGLTVVGPKHDRGVVVALLRLHLVDQPADHVVNVADAGVVPALHLPDLATAAGGEAIPTPLGYISSVYIGCNKGRLNAGTAPVPRLTFQYGIASHMLVQLNSRPPAGMFPTARGPENRRAPWARKRPAHPHESAVQTCGLLRRTPRARHRPARGRANVEVLEVAARL